MELGRLGQRAGRGVKSGRGVAFGSPGKVRSPSSFLARREQATLGGGELGRPLKPHI